MNSNSAFVYVTIQESVEEVTTADGKDLGDGYMDHFQEGFETAVEPGDLGFSGMDIASVFHPFLIKLKVLTTGKVSECDLLINDNKQYMELKSSRDPEEEGELCDDIRNYFLNLFEFDRFEVEVWKMQR